jgi:hypothetical protein
MSINNGSSPGNDASAVLLDPPMLTPEQLIEQLRSIRQQIPNFVQLPNNRQTKNLRRLVSSISIELAHEATVGNTPEGMYHDKDLAGRWAAAENEMRSVLRGLASMNLVLRARLCRDTLQTYNVSRELVKQEEHAHLLPHVEAMRRLKKAHRRARPATEPAPKSQVVTEPVRK